jgi:hypothetical protein
MFNKPINFPVVVAVVLGLLAAGGLAAFAWSYSQMLHYRDNSDSIVASAVVDAKEQQLLADEAAFLEESKKPYSNFSGPADFGSVSFDYPKIWSAYNVKNDKDGYQVYFYPNLMPPLSEDTALALRFSVENKSYEEVVKTYNADADKGSLTATPLTIGQTEEFAGFKGLRFDGQVGKNLNGSIALFKVRDKTLSLRVDSSNWLNDFDNIILPSLNFVP